MSKDTTNTTSGAADLPEALHRSTAADGRTELFNLPGYPLMVRAVDFNRIHTESEMRRTALLDEMQKATPPAEQQAPSAAAADTVVLEAALRAIHQAIDLIGEPDTERLRTVRRVLRGAVIVAEDAGEAATAPQPLPAPLSESIDQVERALAIIGVVGAIDGHDVVRRESVLEIARRAAIAAQGGKV